MPAWTPHRQLNGTDCYAALKRQKTLPIMYKGESSSWGLKSPSSGRLRSLPHNYLPRRLDQNCHGRATMQGLLGSALRPLSYAQGSSKHAQSPPELLTHSSSSSPYSQGIPGSASGLVMQGCPEPLQIPELHGSPISHAALGPHDHGQGYFRHALPSGLFTQGSSSASQGWAAIIPPAVTAADALQPDAAAQLKL